jgi:hypothetical protein
MDTVALCATSDKVSERAVQAATQAIPSKIKLYIHRSTGKCQLGSGKYHKEAKIVISTGPIVSPT